MGTAGPTGTGAMTAKTATGPGTGPTSPASQNLSFLQKYGEDPDAATGKTAVAPGTEAEEEAPESSEPSEEDITENKGIDVPVQNVKKAGEKVKSGVLKLPSWGSLAFPITVLIILFALIIRVNGKSRAEWLLDVLFGKAHLPVETETVLVPNPVGPPLPVTVPKPPGLGGPAGSVNPLAAPAPPVMQDVQSLDGRVLEPANTFQIAATGEG